MTTTAAFQPRLDTFADRILWVRVFELGNPSRMAMAELLGDGYNDATLGTWENGDHEPRKMHVVARRYEAVAKAHGVDYITAEWILDGGVIIDSRHIRHAA